MADNIIVKFGEHEAQLRGTQWSCRNVALLVRLRQWQASEFPDGYGAAEPLPEYHAATLAAAALGGKVLSAAPVREDVVDRIY